MSARAAYLNGAPAYVERSGTGAPLLLIGGAVPTWWADPLTAELAMDFDCVNFDYRAPTDWDGAPEGRTQVAVGEDASRVLDVLAIPRAHVVGYSRGAVAAFSLAFNRPDQVDRLVLLAPVAPFADLLVEVQPDDLPADPASVAELYLDLLFSNEFLAANREQAIDLVRRFEMTNATAVRVPRRREQPVPDDAVVDRPTLVVLFGADRMVGRENARRVMGALPQHEVVTMAGASHMAPIEEPQRVAAAIRKFLR